MAPSTESHVHTTKSTPLSDIRIHSGRGGGSGGGVTGGGATGVGATGDEVGGVELSPPQPVRADRQIDAATIQRLTVSRFMADGMRWVQKTPE